MEIVRVLKMMTKDIKGVGAKEFTKLLVQVPEAQENISKAITTVAAIIKVIRSRR